MTKKELTAIKTIVDYLWEDEERHFEENDKPKNHIFRQLKTLKNLKPSDHDALAELKENLHNTAKEARENWHDRLKNDVGFEDEQLTVTAIEEGGLMDVEALNDFENIQFDAGYICGLREAIRQIEIERGERAC
jgi:hypothetical protein